MQAAYYAIYLLFCQAATFSGHCNYNNIRRKSVVVHLYEVCIRRRMGGWWGETNKGLSPRRWLVMLVHHWLLTCGTFKEQVTSIYWICKRTMKVRLMLLLCKGHFVLGRLIYVVLRGTGSQPIQWMCWIIGRPSCRTKCDAFPYVIQNDTV